MKKEEKITTKRYKDYDKEIQEKIQNIINNLLSKDSHFNESFYIELDMLASLLQIEKQARENLLKEPLTTTDKYGRQSKNSNFPILTQVQTSIASILKDFGQTPMSISKINNLNKRGQEDINTSEYIKDLMR